MQTVKGAIAEYFESVTKKKSKSSFKQERTYFKDLEHFCFKNKISLLIEITPKHIEDFQTWLLGKPKKPQTVNRQFTVYNHFFDKCIQWGWIDVSPSRFCKKLREIEPIRVLWNKSQYKLAVKLAKPRWFRNVLRFLRYSGIRPQEAGEIRMCDISLEEEFIRLFMPKVSEYRVIAINEKLRRIIFMQSRGKKKHDFLFLNDKGRKVTTHRINQKLKKLQKEHGITTETAYAFRHGYATNLCRKDVNLEKVRKALGHKKISTTLKYTHVDLEVLKEVSKIKY